jgi:hypothetical protein
VIVSRRRRDKRGVIPFTLLMVGLAIWSMAYAAELWRPDLPGKMWAIRFEFVGIVATPVMIFLFSVENTGGDRWLTRRNLVLVSIIPALTVIVLWTNDLHHLFYERVWIDASGPFPNFVADHGVWF